MNNGLAAATEAWWRWLSSDAIDDATGLCVSWRDLSGQSPGYVYEEATAWALVLPGFAARRPAVRDALAVRTHERGGLARHGRTYLFDTGVGLAAALACKDGAWADRLLDTIEAFIASRRGVDEGPTAGEETDTTRWSDAFGSHLLWLIGPLDAAGRSDLADTLLEVILDACLRNDGLAVHAATDRVYAHAMAYAAEGLSQREATRSIAARLTDTLLDHLHEATVRSHLSHGVGRLDATAQTLLLTTRLGLDRPTAIEAMIGALIRETTPAGGVSYEPGSDHANTWATVFAIRAAPPLAGILAVGGPSEQKGEGPSLPRRLCQC